MEPRLVLTRLYVKLRSMPNFPRRVALFAGAIVQWWAATERGAAATLTVVNLNDAGAGSLRQQIATASAGDTIVFTSGLAGRITLTTGELAVSKDLTIAGPGAKVLAINGNHLSRVFNVSSGTLNLADLTLTNGVSASPSFRGGNVLITSPGVLNLRNSRVTGGQSAQEGGGIDNYGVLSLMACTLDNNFCTNSSGGGINSQGSLAMTNCTLAFNGGGYGGGVNNGGTATIHNCTIASNHGGGAAGGLFADGSVSVWGSIIAGNTSPIGPDVNNSAISGGYNFIGRTNGSAGFGLAGSHDQVGSTASPINALLGPLQDNGGSMPTMAPLSGSPVIDRGNSFGVLTDERGRVRPYDVAGIPNASGGDGSDVGALELSPVTLIVTNNNNQGAGSLRQAVLDASPADNDVVTFATNVTGTIVLTNGELAISKDITILGPGATQLAVSGNSNSRVFSCQSGNISLSGLTIRNGRQLGLAGAFEVNGQEGLGGGIFNAATLALSECTIVSNSVAGGQGGPTGSGFAGFGGNGYGGGIANLSTLTLLRCMLLDNTASGGVGGVATNGGSPGIGGQGYGGGIYNSNVLTIVGCTFGSNNATAGAGDGGPGGGNGGGIYNLTTMALTNCTLAGNVANGSSYDFGGGIYDVGSGSTIWSSTLAGNRAAFGGGLEVGGGTPTVGNTIIAGNISSGGAGSGPDISGSILSGDYNLIQDTSGSTISGITAHNITGKDPLLGALQDNGGATLTRALLSGSPAIDKGKSSGLATDQRGAPRPFDFASVTNASGGDGSDIGAFELGMPRLNIQISGSNLALSWPSYYGGFAAQSVTNLTFQNWSNEVGTLSVNAGQYFLTISGGSNNKFFRLKQ
jgi:hypothetical protein